jgi:M6 family metalloprotease-like protein
MKDFYEENSYGLFTVSAGPGGIVNWATAANNHDYYGTNVSNFDQWPGTLVIEAVTAADSGGFDFAPYDQDGDCYVDVINIVHQGTGEEAGGPPTDIWSHRWNLNDALLDGRSSAGEYTTNDPCPSGGFIKVNDYVIQPETLTPGLNDMITIGVFAHEYGHALGLPDLYDTDGSSGGIGFWSLMASGSWNSKNKLGDTPAHMDAWSKYFLGWVQPTEVSGTLTGESISEASNNADVYKLLNGTPTSGEYFLVENRQQTGFDAALPGAGILIWHIAGDTVNTCTFYLNNVNNAECPSPPCPSDHYGVTLVQADNNWNLEKTPGNRGDAGDTYKSTGNSTFTNISLPNSRLHSGDPSTVSVTSISAPGPVMTADLSASPPAVTALMDGGFDSSTLPTPNFPNANPYWDECSINVGTPICNNFFCGSDGSGPRSPLYWVWFGGIPGFPEVSSVDQDFTLPGRSCAELTFWLEIPTFGTTGYMNAVLDGKTVFTATDADSGTYTVPYKMATVDISAYADTAVHNLSFEAMTDAGISWLSFHLDDVDITPTPMAFNDVSPGHWAENYISAIACNDITLGCGGNNFCPAEDVTREQMAAFLVRAVEGEPSPTYCGASDPFNDVPFDNYFCPYIKRLAELGITVGCGDNNFCPLSAVTREEMAAFIIRALFGESFSYISTPHFSDVSGGTFFKYIQRLYEEGITRGCTSATYCPNDTVKRDQMGAFLTRAFLK